MAARKRDRSREGAGKSERSDDKHSLIAKGFAAQVMALRQFLDGRILLIDGNAGDGEGVSHKQTDLFETRYSTPTPEILVKFAARDGRADVVLCEWDDAKRASLAHRYGQLSFVTIIKDHADAKQFVKPWHLRAIWVSDPCGPKDHGIEHMRAVADQVDTDFIVAFNEGWLCRPSGQLKADANSSAKKAFETMRKYLPMANPDWWLEALNCKHMSRTRVVMISNNFKCRVMVIAGWLADGARRRPFEVYK